tara:strand:+ start:57 stop:998 length:942 start_codon:yes stop_codon:yes gene_type:complete
MSNYITPISDYPALSSLFGVDLKVKHEDAYPSLLGGNKARKMEYIAKEIERKNYNAIVTSGSPHSNHLRAASMMALKKGWEATFIVHDAKQSSLKTGNSMFLKLSGQKIINCDKVNVPFEMDKEMDKLNKNGFKPYYIYGGGECLPGNIAYRDFVLELKYQFSQMSWFPNYIIIASGMGGTLAGIHFGCGEFDIDSKLIGISISRKKNIGLKGINNAINSLNAHYNIHEYSNLLCFRDDWIGKGYGDIYPEIIKTIKFMFSNSGLLLDPIYTGKAFYGFTEMVLSKEIKPKSRVLFIHTGGTMNLISKSNYFF